MAKHATLYGESFVVTGHEAGREEAVEWLTKEVSDVLLRLQTQVKPAEASA